MQNLYEKIDIAKEAIKKHAPDVIIVPKYIF
jgi:hypothetical protein